MRPVKNYLYPKAFFPRDCVAAILKRRCWPRPEPASIYAERREPPLRTEAPRSAIKISAIVTRLMQPLLAATKQ